MPRGGRRPGAGRKPGSVARMMEDARDKAAETGELPHEFLLRVVRGEDTFDDYVTVRGKPLMRKRKPSFAERMDAAKAAAPYYQPRLAHADIAHTGHFTLEQVAASVAPQTTVAVAKEVLRGDGYEFDD
ncbi:hypothetical protein R70211_06785 [Paraburkholderia domus]|uniref:Uncharacterized protein n=2 Tax=Paraburkholderia domus TaxID=2793075 RepID=A0A9N8R7E5_9BURK|nr:hypothetical protein R70211_06785 [Paraburkholderia domus]